MTHYRGSCLCGHVAFVVEGAFNNVTNCHCITCQKVSGAPYVTWVEFPTAQITWTGAEPTWRTSSDKGERGFCPECGSTVTFRFLGSDATDLACVLFDDPSIFAPSDELYTDSRQSWTVLNERLTHFPKERTFKPKT